MSNDQDLKRISNRDLIYALFLQHNNKAPVTDNLNTLVIKELCKTFLELLKELFNKCLLICNFPKIWKRRSVEFFLKRKKVLSRQESIVLYPCSRLSGRLWNHQNKNYDIPGILWIVTWLAALFS